MIRPNFIFIVADDLGYADLGCYGGRPASFGAVSPHLDALAAHGMRFVNGYSNSPVCSPTRFALMTARYQYRLRAGADEPISSRSRGSDVLGLPPAVPTLPSLLREAGYGTALIGKWHLGFLPHFGPLKSGYDEFIGPMSGGVDYFTHATSNGSHDLVEGEADLHSDEYLTDLLSRRAVDYVRRDHGKPFFMSLHYTAPHWPWETREDRNLPVERKENMFHLNGGNVETYRRMIHHMDEGIGALVQALRDTGQLDNTLIVFTSDNGGERFSDSWPLVGGKMDLTEGGIRVPYIAHWPALIPPGTVSQQPCMTMDWSATMIALGGGQPQAEYPLDGVSLLPALRDADHSFARPLYWRMKHRDQQACRIGDWKYLKIEENEYLFNLAEDARERANRAKWEPERFTAMRQAWHDWHATVPPTPPDALVSLVYGLQDMPQR
ncbi:MAG: Arylsulfatase [Pseudomonadota bacterium]|jgi:arylsulfatase A-like enzyme